MAVPLVTTFTSSTPLAGLVTFSQALEITVRGYGTLSPIGRPQERTEVPRRGATEPSQTHADPGHLSRSRSRSRRRAL